MWFMCKSWCCTKGVQHSVPSPFPSADQSLHVCDGRSRFWCLSTGHMFHHETGCRCSSGLRPEENREETNDAGSICNWCCSEVESKASCPWNRLHMYNIRVYEESEMPYNPASSSATRRSERAQLPRDFAPSCNRMQRMYSRVCLQTK